MSDKNDHYEGALLEEMDHKLDALLEGQQSLAQVPGDPAQLKDGMTVVKADIKTIKAVITNHEGRITRLEQPT